MDDLREKVMKGLEFCKVSIQQCECPVRCPYEEKCWAENDDDSPMHLDLMRDALILLKAQDEVIEALLKVGYPHNFQREEPWIRNYMVSITEVVRKAVRLRNKEKVIPK